MARSEVGSRGQILPVTGVGSSFGQAHERPRSRGVDSRWPVKPRVEKGDREIARARPGAAGAMAPSLPIASTGSSLRVHGRTIESSAQASAAAACGGGAEGRGAPSVGRTAPDPAREPTPSAAPAAAETGGGNYEGDLTLAARIRAGDREAEEEMVRRFGPGLHAIARCRAGKQDAPDLLQETMLVALGNLRQARWRGEAPLAAYLAGILRRLSLHHASREGDETEIRRAQESRSVGDPLAEALRLEARQRIAGALACIAPPWRDVLIRFYLEDQSVAQISQQMGIPRGTVLSRLFHARRKLRRILRAPRPIRTLAVRRRH